MSYIAQLKCYLTICGNLCSIWNMLRNTYMATMTDWPCHVHKVIIPWLWFWESLIPYLRWWNWLQPICYQYLKCLTYIVLHFYLSLFTGRWRISIHSDKCDFYHWWPDLLRDRAVLQGYPPCYQCGFVCKQSRFCCPNQGHETGIAIWHTFGCCCLKWILGQDDFHLDCLCFTFPRCSLGLSYNQKNDCVMIPKSNLVRGGTT